ncbi:helix-turn-helix transcriptional regulator [Nonomuraea sp. MG754425]|uniref:helix-turn-helix transcriptional regulator n=1 Tax=Nonomuraea sp. MG754425 TaxID=2570319 RepID=UPI001F3B7EBD|nr:AraC family transcriptional regulator [Nonomuraea sp. MG754425]MCF6476612.1 helix-turn-helix transcriptional regulator [Nonomuraea sp. MG754425]
MAIHSLPSGPGPGPYEVVVRPSPPRLRPYVLGWAGFRARAGAAPPSRMLPLNAATLIVDLTAMTAIVTGPRAEATPPSRTPWLNGVAAGLTPAGMAALTGTPMREVAGATVPLECLVGDGAAELAGRLAAAPGRAARLGLLEQWLTARLRPASCTSDGLILHAWRRLQQPPDGRLTIASLADELGVSRRYLELGFGRVVGLTPKTVARIARFQRAVDTLRRPVATLGAAVACGYADQPHLSREIGAMTGMTPKRLCAFVQDVDRLAE